VWVVSDNALIIGHDPCRAPPLFALRDHDKDANEEECQQGTEHLGSPKFGLWDGRVAERESARGKTLPQNGENFNYIRALRSIFALT
jgi:hypothetical protein